MSIRRRLLLSYTALIVLVLVFLALSGTIRAMKGQMDADRNAMLLLKNDWSQMQISLNNMIINWQDGASFQEFKDQYAGFDRRLAGIRFNQTAHIDNMRDVWSMARVQLDLIVNHVENPGFDQVQEAVGRTPGLQRLNHLWVELYSSSSPARRRMAYQIETLISLVEFFPIYSDTVNHMFDVILAESRAAQERMALFESVAIAAFFVLFMAVSVFLSVWFSHSLSRPIIRVSARLNQFMGRNSAVAVSSGHDEVRALARTAEHMMRHYTKLAQQAHKLARGEVEQFQRVSTVNGIVGRSMEEIGAYFAELTQTSTWIRNGDYDVRIQPKSSHDILADNINTMADVIREKITTLQSMFESIDEGVLVVDGNLRILEHNRRLSRILGVPASASGPADDAQIPPAVARLPHELRTIVNETLAAVGRSEHYRTLEGRAGHSVPVRINARRLDPVGQQQSTVMFLISNESRKERAKRERERLRAHAVEAELRALRAQIDPHFFFNTLNTIAYLVETNVENAVGTIEKLADLFRYSLASTGKERVTIKEEIDQIQRYIDIESLRYGSHLRSSFTCEPALLSARIPPMLLQPLVENAVRYGRDTNGLAKIEIRAERENDSIRLEVIDTGTGDYDFHDFLNGSGTGIRNVNHRLKALYHEQLYFKPREEHGLIVGMRIPVRDR